MGIVPIDGLWETHLTVSDLVRSIAFYRDTLGLTLAHRVPERHAAFGAQLVSRWVRVSVRPSRSTVS